MFETVLCYIVQFSINNSELSHSFQRSILALEPTEPPSTEEETQEQFHVETSGRKQSKSNIGAVVGSLSACLVLIIVVVIVLRKYAICEEHF